MKHYFPIPDSAKELKIHASYALGGTNFLTYKAEPRGLYVHFTVVEREQRPGGFMSERTELLAKTNFKMFALPLGRKSQKRLAELEAYISQNAEQLAELHHGGEYEALYRLVGAFGPLAQAA